MRNLTRFCAVLGGGLFAVGCTHHTSSNGFGGSTTTATDTTTHTTTTAGGACLVNADCPQSGNFYCQLPEDTCPKCYWQTPMCSSNADCATGMLCGACKTCVASCESTSNPTCPANQACSSTTMVCEPACQADTDCATNFACIQGTCARKTCSADTDCKGFCAGGVCVAQKGACVGCP